MKTNNSNKQNFISSFIVITFVLLAHTGFAQNSSKAEIKRTKLQQHDLSTSGKEAVQVSIDFPSHTAFGKHSHPGEEIIYVLKGSLQYEVEGSLPVTLKAGEVLFIPAGTVHSAKNNSSEEAVELATYVVEKGKPLVVMEK
jgi:quercetin dioxygenase-like cupin family protein